MEEQLFEVKERKVLKTIPVWFMIICGVFYACQLILFSISKSPFYIYNTPISFNLTTFALLMIGASLFILVLIFTLYSFTPLIFKICCGATMAFALILCIPFNANFLSYVFYIFIVAFQCTVLSLIALTIKQFNVTSVFKNCSISLISGCGIYAIFLATKLSVYSPVFIILTLACAGMMIGAIKLFPNKYVIEKSPRITRTFSDKEKKHNPYLSKKPSTQYPLKTSLALLLIVVACSIVYFINENQLLTLNVPNWIFYACASFGALVFAIVFKFSSANIFKVLLIYLGVAFLGTIFLFTGNLVLEYIGTCLFSTCLIAFSLNTFYASVLFAEVSSKLVLFSTLALQVIASLLTSSLLQKLNSSIVIMAISIIIIAFVIFVILFSLRFIKQIWQVSLSPNLALNNRLKDSLTQTELLIFELMVLGYTRNQVATILYLRKDAINSHMASIISKIWSSGLSDKYMKTFKN